MTPIEANETSPSEGDTEPQTALTRIVETGQLTQTQMTANPRTGLVEIKLGGGVSVPIMHSVAPLRSDDARAAQESYHSEVEGGRQNAINETRKLDTEAEKTGAFNLIPQAQSTALELSTRLDAAKSLDSIRMMLNLAAGEDVEDRLIAEITKRISMEHGFDMIEVVLQNLYGDRSIHIDSIEALNKLLPNVTTLEVALISLMDRVPNSLMSNELLSMIYLLHIQGIEWATDEYDPELQRFAMDAADPYQYIGVTNANTATEHTFFSERIQSLIQATLKSKLTDRYFFDFIWSHFDSSIMRGLALLKKHGNPKTLLNKELVDLHDNRSFPPSKITRLIGLLQKVPGCPRARPRR